MQHNLLNYAILPKEVVQHILSYNKHFKIRKGEVVDVISYDDARREPLTQISRIDSEGHVLLHENDRYEVHALVDISGVYVRWTMYKYYKHVGMQEIENENLMDGVVFSMVRSPIR